MNLNKLLFIPLLFVVFSVFGQKIKIKKDKVLIDKKPIALFEKIENNKGKLLTLTGEEVAIIEIKSNGIKTPKGVETVSYLSFSNGSKTAESDFKYLSFTFNFRKAIAEYMLKELNLFSKDKFEATKLTAFIEKNEPRPSLKIEEELKNETKRVEKLFKEYNPFVLKNGLIVKKDSYNEETTKYDVVYGYFTSKKSNEKNQIFIYNKEKQQIASYDYVTKRMALNNNYIQLSKFSPSNDSQIAKVQFLKILYSEGEFLSIPQAFDVDGIEVVSNNIYKEKGYAKTIEGEKFEGEILAYFENIKDRSQKWTSLFNKGKYGKNIVVITKRKSGGFNLEDIESDKLEIFCIQKKDSSKVCYRALNGLKNISSKSKSGIVSLDKKSKKRIVEIIDESGKVKIYKEPTSKEFIIKTDEVENAVNLSVNNSSIEETKNKIKTLLNIKAEEIEKLDFSNLDDIKKLENFIK